MPVLTRWLPLVRTRDQPSCPTNRIASRTFGTAQSLSSQFQLEPAERLFQYKTSLKPEAIPIQDEHKGVG